MSTSTKKVADDLEETGVVVIQAVTDEDREAARAVEHLGLPDLEVSEDTHEQIRRARESRAAAARRARDIWVG